MYAQHSTAQCSTRLIADSGFANTSQRLAAVRRFLQLSVGFPVQLSSKCSKHVSMLTQCNACPLYVRRTIGAVAVPDIRRPFPQHGCDRDPSPIPEGSWICAWCIRASGTITISPSALSRWTTAPDKGWTKRTIHSSWGTWPNVRVN